MPYYRVQQAEYVIHILVAAPQESVKTKQVTRTRARPEQPRKGIREYAFNTVVG